MKSSNIGGQAVIEGVMMKNKDRYAVAVRKPDGEIEVTTDTYKSVVGKYTALTKLPLPRLVDSCINASSQMFCKRRVHFVINFSNVVMDVTKAFCFFHFSFLP